MLALDERSLVVMRDLNRFNVVVGGFKLGPTTILDKIWNKQI